MDHLILLWPDGTAVGRQNNAGEPTRSPRPQFAYIFSSQIKRTNYVEANKHFGFTRATLRVEVIRDVDTVEYDMREPGEAFCAACPDHEACATGTPCSIARKVNNDKT